jgi:hypothetical protein
MRKSIFLATLVAVLLPAFAHATGGALDQWGFPRRGAARAAPWFLYWPYGAYWSTPAPTGYPGGWGPMTAGPFQGQIGPAAGGYQGGYGPAFHHGYGQWRGPTGFDY